MRSLKEIMDEHRGEFDFEEPSEGHFERFLEKLPSENRNRKLIVRIAAALAGVSLILFSVQYYRSAEQVPNNISVLSPEVQETLYYYSMQNTEMLELIKNLETVDQNAVNRINQDLKNYDKNYRYLMEDLNRFPGDPRVINAIIEHHRSKTEMLGHIVVQLNELSV